MDIFLFVVSSDTRFLLFVQYDKIQVLYNFQLQPYTYIKMFAAVLAVDNLALLIQHFFTQNGS
jgi:hypothetical protein